MRTRDSGSSMRDVSRVPQLRGTGDTGWSGATVLAGWRRLFRMLAASLLVHALLTPFPALLGLVGMLPALDLSGSDRLPEEELTAIPIEFFEVPADGVLSEESDDPGPEGDPEPQDAEEQANNTPEASLSLGPEPEAEKDDSAAKAKASGPDGAVKPEERTVKKPAKPELEGTDEDEIGDPVALAGAAGKVADSNANIRLVVHNQVVRQAPAGPRVGELLRRTPQWRDFLEPAGVDPVADIDHLLVAGPQFYNSKNIVAVVQHRLEPPQVDRALESLVARNGKWVSREKRRAEAFADGAQRLFAAPNQRIIAVAPLSAAASLDAIGPTTQFPSSPEGVAAQAYVVTPWKVLRGTGVKLPKSLTWLRAEARPTEGGGVLVRLLAQDESPKSAKKHAKELEPILRKAVEIDFSQFGALGGALAVFALGSSKKKMVERVDLSAKGDQIEGELQLTKNQLNSLLDILDGWLPEGPKVEPADSLEADVPGDVPDEVPSDMPGDEVSSADGEAMNESEPMPVEEPDEPSEEQGTPSGDTEAPQPQREASPKTEPSHEAGKEADE